MLSKQAKASRRNGKKSSGPVTNEGKAISSMNAVTYGLRATSTVITSPNYNEDPEQYHQLLSSLFEELQPQSVLEHHLVRKIADSLWRYQRVIRAETASLQSALERISRRDFTRYDDHPDLDSEQGRADYQTILDHRKQNFIDRHQIPDDPDAVQLHRYELRLERQLSHAYALLTLLQHRCPEGLLTETNDKENAINEK